MADGRAAIRRFATCLRVLPLCCLRMRLILICLCAVALAGCSSSGGSSNGLAVTATTTQVADLVRAVGGTRVDVTQILKPNADPHEYEPRPSDALALAHAKIVFRSGGDVDEWLAPVVQQAGSGDRVITLSDSVTTLPSDNDWYLLRSKSSK